MEKMRTVPPANPSEPLRILTFQDCATALQAIVVVWMLSSSNSCGRCLFHLLERLLPAG
jgi:hypothetical protein